MFRHILTLTFRNFTRHRSSFIINLLGLTAGLATALIIFLWVLDELGMNTFHEKNDRLYQVMEHQEYAGEIMTTTSTPGILAEALKEEIPEVEHAATVTWVSKFTLSVGEKNLKSEGWYVGPDFFNIFSFRLIHGQPDQVLEDIQSIVISEGLAESLFEDPEKAMGETIKFDHDELFKVTGIFEDIPDNSSYQFDFVLSFEKYKEDNNWVLQWYNNGPSTFITLVDGVNEETVEKKIPDFVKERNEESNVTLFLQPFSDRYLYNRYENGKQAGGRIEYVRLFSIVAIFILIIACINFMNLSTAKASFKAKEVGVKKTVGASKWNMILQYLFESTTTAFIALFFAVLVVWLFLPRFNLMTGKELDLAVSAKLLVGFILLTFFTGLIAGSYPAFYLSSFQPVSVLKNEIKRSMGEVWARKGLVIFQFSLSVILIVAVIVIYNQIQYIQNKNLGYHKDNLVYFSTVGTIDNQKDAFLNQARQLPGVTAVSTTSYDMVGRNSNTSGLAWDGKNPEDRILFENVRVNYDLLETIGVEFKEGRSFSREFGADSSRIIFNEKAIQVMGMDDPIGQTIRLWDRYDLEIVGVVKDFHFQSFHEDIEPLYFWLRPEETYFVIARLEAGHEQEGLTNLRELYEGFNPGFPFEFEFVNEQYARQYEAETRVASLSRYFAGLAILISCLGLFGLSIFMAERKKKEIGIRKVLGASAFHIIGLLTSDFTKSVLISILIGLPVSYYIVSQWLGQFTYRIDLNLWFFVLSGILVLVISWLTVSSQAYRSAIINPSECIRDE